MANAGLFPRAAVCYALRRVVDGEGIMASLAGASYTATETGSPLVRVIDRWIFFFVAALMFAVALAGFVPKSLEKIAAIEAGTRAPFPLVLHFHAVMMGSWLSLLLVQTGLAATGRRNWHRGLGVAGFVLIPAVLLSMLLVAPAMYAPAWNALVAAGADAPAALRKAVEVKNNIILGQLRAGFLFALLTTLALRARRHDPGLHKRFMLLATLALMGAAINRVPELPQTMPGSTLSLDLYGLAIIAPLFVWDLVRNGTIHRAYLTWFPIWLAATIPVYLLWGTPWWQALGPRLMGMQ